MTTSYAPSADGGSSLVAAAQWIEGALLGRTATAIAIIAVAGLGFLLLTGQVNFRRSATVVMGCFILFGAPVIATRLHQVASAPDWQGPVDDVALPIASPEPLPLPSPATRPPAYDPYAGASVPVR